MENSFRGVPARGISCKSGRWESSNSCESSRIAAPSQFAMSSQKSKSLLGNSGFFTFFLHRDSSPRIMEEDIDARSIEDVVIAVLVNAKK